MGKTEPTFVPEWLKNQSSSSHTDDKCASNSSKKKSLDNDSGRPATSSRCFGLTRDRDWVKVKEKPENRVNRRREYSESLANILPSWFDDDGVTCSHSNLSTKRVGSWSRKLGSEETGNGSRTSVLAQVPLMVGASEPMSVAATGGNMVESRAHGYPRATAAPQVSMKQSWQLIPKTPTPKSSEKLKVKNVANPRSVCVNADVTKAASSTSSSGGGKLHVLKPSHERNKSVAKETASPTDEAKLPNCPQAGFLDHKSYVSSTLEKRPSPQAKSRNDFFNLMRRKSTANKSDAQSAESANDNAGEGGTQVPPSDKNNLSCNVTDKVTRKGNNHAEFILYSEEEEARFLRSLGWEETNEEGGLTEEEINDFYMNLRKGVIRRGTNFFKGMQPKCLMSLNNLLVGKNGVDT